MHTDMYIIPLFISGTILFILFSCFLIAYLIIQKNKQNDYQVEKNKMMHDHEMNILNTRIEEQERTMNHLSKEIHDNIMQVLSFAKLNLNVLENIDEIKTAHENITLVKKIESQIVIAMTDLRNLSHSLNSEYIGVRGLADVLERTLEYVKSLKNISFDIQIVGVYKTLDVEKELLIYRIAQESIHNVVRHSRASMINLQLKYEPASFAMKIKDNGIGFDPFLMNENDGIGISNMRQRAKALNGTFAVDSKPNNGCIITLNLNI
jgi:signal transduction histidine kinase